MSPVLYYVPFSNIGKKKRLFVRILCTLTFREPEQFFGIPFIIHAPKKKTKNKKQKTKT